MTDARNSKGRKVGLTLGWVALVINIILIVLAFMDISASGDSFINPVIIFFGINFLACNSWLYGATFYKFGYMLFPMIWWQIPVFFFIVFAIISTMRGLMCICSGNQANDGIQLLLFGIVCTIIAAFHVTPIFCFISMKKAKQTIQPMNESALDVVFTYYNKNCNQNNRY